MVDQQTDRVRIANEQVTETVRVTPEAMRDVLAQLTAPQAQRDKAPSESPRSNFSPSAQITNVDRSPVPPTSDPEQLKTTAQPLFSDDHLTTEQLDVAAIPGMRTGHALVRETPDLKLVLEPASQDLTTNESPSTRATQAVAKPLKPQTPSKQIDPEAVAWALDEMRIRLAREMASAA